MTVADLEFFLSETRLNIRRHALMSLATIGTVAASLAILGACVLLILNVNLWVGGAQRELEIYVHLKPTVTRAQGMKLRDRLAKLPEVGSTRFVTREEGLQQLQRDMNIDSDALQAMDENPLKDRIVLRARNPQDLPALAGVVETLPEVANVVSPMETTKRVLLIARIIRSGSLIAVILLCLAGVLIVHNTIRLTIFARRREIGVMQVVGATNLFVSGPYLLEGMALGLTGALVAAGLVLGGYYYLLGRAGESLRFVPLVSDPTVLAKFALATLGAGVALGLIGSVVSVSRYLKRIPA